MGYVHRDLKPENIVLDLDSLEVRLIDFNHAVQDSESTSQIEKGTPGYKPTSKGWPMGSYKWDMWALAAIICEADMPRDSYMTLDEEAECLRAIKKHTQKKSTDERLSFIMGELLLTKGHEGVIEMDTFRKELTRLKFQKQSHDI